MTPIAPKLCTAFQGHTQIASGPLAEVALAVWSASADRALIFDDATGKVVDLDMRGSVDEVMARLPGDEPRGPGRPKLGVVAREVTLLPRHWDWLNSQPGGASVALRKLVEEARKSSGDKDRTRIAQEAAYHFMSAAAGNLPGFEEAARALFAYDRPRFSNMVAAWPADVRDYAVKLAFSDTEPVK